MILSERQGDGDEMRCLLCPHGCLLSVGSKGICRVRENDGASIKLLTYGVISSYASDPVEKKPLYHFFPGRSVLSVGSFGCNMRCDFCQNDQISQQGAQRNSLTMEPAELVTKALSISGNIGLAYTYNEPAIWFEYVIDCAVMIKESALHNVMITNGFINENPLKEYLKYIDAFNIDLKAFNEGFYHHYTGASLKPVLKTLVSVAEAGRHLEVTTLIIPGLNDSVEEMRSEAKWIAENLGSNVPLHISRYFPRYRRDDPPTPFETIRAMYETASEHLRFVYTGNVPPEIGGSNTVCHVCGKTLIKRSGYNTRNTGLTDEGRCSECDEIIIASDYMSL